MSINYRFSIDRCSNGEKAAEAGEALKQAWQTIGLREVLLL